MQFYFGPLGSSSSRRGYCPFDGSRTADCATNAEANSPTLTESGDGWMVTNQGMEYRGRLCDRIMTLARQAAAYEDPVNLQRDAYGYL